MKTKTKMKIHKTFSIFNFPSFIMIVGNSQNIETLKKYIDMVFAGDAKAPHFIIVS